MKYRGLTGSESGSGKIFMQATAPTIANLAEPGDCWFDGTAFHQCVAEDPVTHVLTWSSAILIPIGGIIGMSGALSSCPTDFAVCDGIENAPGPDLTAQFII